MIKNKNGKPSLGVFVFISVILEDLPVKKNNNNVSKSCSPVNIHMEYKYEAICTQNLFQYKYWGAHKC